ncbi:sugar phosphate isomerase/epimerase family protein [Nocardioides iriomotensis]|uniref:Sugar phosphate isomerase/epimerase n=1 Tax=Nocardioides iriomotensis TaxID=715784 RepID=A0A4Q5J953_9ACTN|nr:sugar phosphate isomerase/epimerase [Nocardioides iriomotensis]RYU15260.1 sugar phosphate isomerase/epimerase [Nocardioides iriomotensis]
MCYGYDGHAALRESMERRGASRRSFLKGAAASLAGAAAVGAGALPASAAVHAVRRVPPGKISIQLYTLRSIMSGDGIEATLAKLEEYGYPRVELAGLYGRTASSFRSTLDSYGIRASSSHDGISGSTAALHQKLQNAVTLGQNYVNVPYLNSAELSAWQEWADQMNAEAAVAKGYGLRYGYHNHAHEFTIRLSNGQTPWEVFTERLDPSLVHLEADLYWVVTGGLNSGDGVADPEQFAIDTIKAAPQTVRQYHVKDKQYARPNSDGDHVDLGTGFIEFDRIFAAHTVEEYIVENDSPDVTPLQTAEVGYNYLRTLRF